MKYIEIPEQLSVKMSEDDLQKVKMLFEINDLEHKCNWLQQKLTIVPLVIPLIATLITIVSLLSSGYILWIDLKEQYKKQQQQEQVRLEQAAMTYKKPIWEKHLNVYFDTVDVVSKIATSPPESQLRKDEEQKFWQMYHGSLVFVEDDDLRRLKVDFANCLQGVEEICTKPELEKDARLKELAQSFANTARESLGRKWQQGGLETTFNPTDEPTVSDTNK